MEESTSHVRHQSGQRSNTSVRILQITVVYYCDGDSVRTDNDNLIKPIQGVLIGLVYADHDQITDASIRRRFLITGLSRSQHVARSSRSFCRGEQGGLEETMLLTALC